MGFDFFGNKARKDIANANNQANAALSEGYGQQTAAYDEAGAMYDPYIASGRKSSGMYDDFLGVNGQGNALEAYTNLAANPAFSGKLAQDSNAVAKNLNARGMGAGGTAALAGERVFQSNIGNWLDRYRDAGRDGFSATGAKSNIVMGKGDAAYGYAGTRANQAVGYGNALSQTRNAGLNNLLNVAGTVISGANAMRKPPGMG
jgi:hypothetical protein